MPFSRLITAAYENGVDEPRGGRRVYKLPNPRAVSNAVHGSPTPRHPTITHMLPLFGQFVDHDLTLTAEEGEPLLE